MRKQHSPSLVGLNLVGLAGLSLVASMAAGCFIERDKCGGWYSDECDYISYPDYPPDVQSTPDVVQAPIETDETMVFEPGEGTGVFIEYTQGGRWQVWTTCYDAPGELPCDFSVEIESPRGGAHIKDFYCSPGCDDYSVGYDWRSFRVWTGGDVGGAVLEMTAGVPVRFYVTLDGQSEAHYTYWVGNGVVHYGAPSNPIELKPTLP